MSRRYNGYREYRSRGSRHGRGSGQNDAIVVALTMQILVCVALLLAAGTLKKVDGPGFARIDRKSVV